MTRSTDDAEKTKRELTSSEETEREMFRRYRATRDLATRDVLVCAYLPLVHSITRKFYGLGESQGDLIQEGSIGLLNAVDHFDPTLGVKFSTYATHLVTSQIQHYLRDRGRLIRQPAWVQELNAKVTRVMKRLSTELVREATPAEVADELHLAEESIQEVLAARRLNQIVSLTAPREDGDDSELLIIDRSKIHTTKHSTLRLPIEDRIVVEEAIDKLKLLEQKVIRLFFFGEFSQSEIAKKLGISTNYTSYLLHRSLGKLKDDLNAQRSTESSVLYPPEAAPAAKPAGFPRYDALTGLYSAAYFRAFIEEEVKRHQEVPRAFAIILAEVEMLPAEVELQQVFLTEVGKSLAHSVRKFDLVAHLREGCFALLLPQSRQEATFFAERLCRQLANRGWKNAERHRVVLHIGIAVFPDDGPDCGQLLAHAERMLLTAGNSSSPALIA